MVEKKNLRSLVVNLETKYSSELYRKLTIFFFALFSDAFHLKKKRAFILSEEESNKLSWYQLVRPESRAHEMSSAPSAPRSLI